MYGGDYMASKGQKFRSYTVEEKLRVVNLHLQNHISIKQLEKQTGIHHSLISEWAKRYSENGIDGLKSHRKGNPYSALHTSKHLSELERLRLLTLKQEIEIERLKKGYIVKGVGASKTFVTISGRNLQ